MTKKEMKEFEKQQRVNNLFMEKEYLQNSPLKLEKKPINSAGTCFYCKNKQITYGIKVRKDCFVYYCHSCKKYLHADSVS